ncbi:MAG: 16S rRNA (guanine(527)-N(7))-methyltransferase RsmG [Bacteroidota bacterium]|nr:16S rRNA (guanine(527)-N(7))-methyltransferase RsmG [Bacteroidota bacterium]
MEQIKKYFPELTADQISKFEKLDGLYRDWNEKINVISRKDIDHLYTHHVLHSLAIAKIISFLPGAKILDVGTGGGFPGIPLAILFPETKFHLVDSIAKKIKVVTEVANGIGLQNVIAEQKRVEELEEKYDFIVSRAVTDLIILYKWNRKNLSVKSVHEMPNGIICLKGGDKLLEEITAMKTHVKTWQISDYFRDPFFETKKVVYVKG